MRAIKEILFESTDEFEADLQLLGAEQRRAVVDLVNRLGNLFAHDRGQFHNRARALRTIDKIWGEFKSSLYVGRLRDLRVIFSADDDPAFERAVITLFAVAQRANVYDRWDSTARRLYGQGFRQRGGRRE